MANIKLINCVFLSFLMALASPAYSTYSKLSPIGEQPQVITPQGKSLKLYSHSYALVISVSEYGGKDPWVKLSNTRKEMDDVSDELRINGFEVHRLTDPDGDELSKVIRSFLANYGREVDTRVVFFFSGHGYFDKQTNEAYLVPRDAMRPSSKNSNFYDKAYAIGDIKTAAFRMPARHGLFIFDNCFSGMVFKSDNVPAQPVDRGNTFSKRWRFLEGNASTPVRQFISAGGPDQVLPAVSIFVPAFIQALKGGASRNNDGYVTGKEIGLFVSEQVTQISRTQTPYSDVLGQVLGDMIFQTGSASGDVVTRTDESVTSSLGAEPIQSTVKSDTLNVITSISKKYTEVEPANSKSNEPGLRWYASADFKPYTASIDTSAMVKLERFEREGSGCKGKDQKFGGNGKYFASTIDPNTIGVFRSSDGRLIHNYHPYATNQTQCALFVYDIFFDNGNKLMLQKDSDKNEHFIYDLVNGTQSQVMIPGNEVLKNLWVNPLGDEFLTYSIRDPNGLPLGDIYFRVFDGRGKILKEKTIPFNKQKTSDYQLAYESLSVNITYGQNLYADGVLLLRNKVISFSSLFNSGKWLESWYEQLGCGREPSAILVVRGNGTTSTLDNFGQETADFKICNIAVGASGLSASISTVQIPRELVGGRHFLQSSTGKNTVIIDSKNAGAELAQGKNTRWGYDFETKKMSLGKTVEISGVLASTGGVATTWFSTPGQKNINLYVVKFKD